jgi:hypothetical protein
LDGKQWIIWTIVTAQLPTHIGGKEKEMVEKSGMEENYSASKK